MATRKRKFGHFEYHEFEVKLARAYDKIFGEMLDELVTDCWFNDIDKVKKTLGDPRGNTLLFIPRKVAIKTNLDAWMTPLMAACANGSQEIVEMLLKRHDAITNIKFEADNMTALDWAHNNDHKNIVKLIERKINPQL